LSFWHCISATLLTAPCGLCQSESMVTHASHSVVADDANDQEIDMDISEEASRTISTAVSMPTETKEYHVPDFQQIHLPLGKSISADDQVSRSEDALETEEVLVASSDASVDDLDDHAIKGVEIVPGEINGLSDSQFTFAVHFYRIKYAQSYHVQV